jgi:hypothetical protein
MISRMLTVMALAVLAVAFSAAPTSAAITPTLVDQDGSAFPPEGDVLTFDPNAGGVQVDGSERTISGTRFIVQTFQVTETFDLSNMYLLIARPKTGASARVRIFPVANTLAGSIQADYDAALASGFMLDQTFTMPTSDPVETRQTMRLELTGGDITSLSAATDPAGYALMFTYAGGGPATDAFTWRGVDVDDFGLYAFGRQYYDDLSTGGDSRIDRDFTVALLGEPFVLGDVDGDGIGGEFPDDFNPIRDNFQQAATERSEGDIVRNGMVDFADFRQWKTAFIAGGGALANVDLSSVAVPEPSSLALLVVGVLGVARRRRD